MNSIDDKDLIARARHGDQRAFADLAGRHRNRIWAVCLRTTGNPHDAEDALQDTLAAAWSNLDKFRGDAQFSTWLYRIASNAALAVARRRPIVAGEVVDSASPARDPGDRLATEEQVHAALSALPEAFRAALVLRVYGDLTYDDIAAHQGIPVQTVKSRLNRARRMLAESLAVARLD